MPTEAKRETIEELTEEARSSSAMIVSEYRGLKVSEFGEIRRNLRKQNVSYRVVKNRLMKIAARNAGAEALGILLEVHGGCVRQGRRRSCCQGGSGRVQDAPAHQDHRAVIGNQVVNAEGVTRLAQLPGRDVLLAQVAGAIAAPMANVPACSMPRCATSPVWYRHSLTRSQQPDGC